MNNCGKTNYFKSCVCVTLLSLCIVYCIYRFSEESSPVMRTLYSLLKKVEQNECQAVLHKMGEDLIPFLCNSIQLYVNKQGNKTSRENLKEKGHYQLALTDIVCSRLDNKWHIANADQSNQLRDWFGEHLNITKGNVTRYITIHLPNDGRVGNKMYQIAVLVGLANLTGHVPILPEKVSPLDKVFDLPTNTYRNISTTRFKVYNKNDIQTPMDFKNMDWTNSLIFSGYFHYYKTFHHLRETVLDVFRFKTKYVNYTIDFISSNVPKGCIKVGIHVRRGDYMSKLETNAGRLTPSLRYYKEAMTFYRCMYENVTFIIVSDDKAWCHKNLQTLDSVISENSDPGADLALMAACDHTIMSVGTFGWWGGWLTGGNVVYYGKPYKPGSRAAIGYSEDDIYPPEWISLS